LIIYFIIVKQYVNHTAKLRRAYPKINSRKADNRVIQTMTEKVCNLLRTPRWGIKKPLLFQERLCILLLLLLANYLLITVLQATAKRIKKINIQLLYFSFILYYQNMVSAIICQRSITNFLFITRSVVLIVNV